MLEQHFNFRLEQIRHQVILAHNLDYVELSDPNKPLNLQAGDEIAILPPVSGGWIMENTADFCDVTDKNFEIPSYMEKLSHNACGATSVFIGDVFYFSFWSCRIESWCFIFNRNFEEYIQNKREKSGCIGLSGVQFNGIKTDECDLWSAPKQMAAWKYRFNSSHRVRARVFVH